MQSVNTQLVPSVGAKISAGVNFDSSDLQADRRMLVSTGYFRELVPEHEVFTSQAQQQLLRAVFNDMPLDPYSGQESGRRRLFGSLYLLPWSGKIEWKPTVIREGKHYGVYDQKGFNPEHQEPRYFCAIPNQIVTEGFLDRLILRDFVFTTWAESDLVKPIFCTVHFMRMEVTPERTQSICCPNCLHQDGEAYTFVHVLERKNITGGVSVVATPECANVLYQDVDRSKVLSEFTLEHPWESFAVKDDIVSHYVSPVDLDDAGQPLGYRDVILIDFSPMTVV